MGQVPGDARRGPQALAGAQENAVGREGMTGHSSYKDQRERRSEEGMRPVKGAGGEPEWGAISCSCFTLQSLLCH